MTPLGRTVKPGGVAAALLAHTEAMGEESGIARPEDFSPERRALHAQIVERFLGAVRPAREGERQAVLTAGGTAAGKTTLIRAALQRNPNMVHIGEDQIKPLLPEFAELRTQGKLGSPGPLDREAGLIAQLALDEAQKRGLNIAYESTFAGPTARREAQILNLLAHGYQVALYAANIPEDEAIARAARRARHSDSAEDSGRTVSERLIRKTHREAARNVLALAHLPTDLTVSENTATGHVAIFGRRPGEPQQVYDQPRYEAYRAKAAQADAVGGTLSGSG